MAAYTEEEALAFIDAMRMTLEGKVGFKWLLEKLAGLSGYIEAIADENEALNAYVDSEGLREGYEPFRAAYHSAGSEGTDNDRD